MPLLPCFSPPPLLTASPTPHRFLASVTAFLVCPLFSGTHGLKDVQASCQQYPDSVTFGLLSATCSGDESCSRCKLRCADLLNESLQDCRMWSAKSPKTSPASMLKDVCLGKRIFSRAAGLRIFLAGRSQQQRFSSRAASNYCVACEVVLVGIVAAKWHFRAWGRSISWTLCSFKVFLLYL